MIIKYAVVHKEQVGKKKVDRFTAGELEWNGDWDADDHESLRQLIYAANPGKNIVGYGPAENWGTFQEQMMRDNGVTI